MFKKTISFFLISLVLSLVGCGQQTPIVNQPTANTDQNIGTDKPTELIADWKSYSDENFSLKYPAFLSQTIEQEGVRTTVYFQGTPREDIGEPLLAVASMPNQAGSTLDDWTNELISQSKWLKKNSIKIFGQTAYVLVLPETDAGRRYIFLSPDSRTMFDMTIQNFDQETVSSIISSFSLAE